MPIYEYDCPSCGKPFEELVYAREQPCCPSCGAMNVVKRLSTFAVTSGTPEAPPPGACGSCGDPRGPGACAR